MKEILFQRPRYFYILFVPFLVMGAYLLITTTKPQLFLYLNDKHSPLADLFFYYNTTLGNGIVFALCCLIFLWRNIAEGILSLIVFAFTALLPQFFKKVIFYDVVRPTKFFEGDTSLHLVEGVKQHSFHSFPSGHSVSIFALALMVTLLVKNKRWGLLFAFIAIITAYSRVYLAQHFFEDIYAGACLGVFCTMISFLLFEKKLLANPKLNRRLFKRIKQKR